MGRLEVQGQWLITGTWRGPQRPVRTQEEKHQVRVRERDGGINALTAVFSCLPTSWRCLPLGKFDWKPEARSPGETVTKQPPRTYSRIEKDGEGQMKSQHGILVECQVGGCWEEAISKSLPQFLSNELLSNIHWTPAVLGTSDTKEVKQRLCLCGSPKLAHNCGSYGRWWRLWDEGQQKAALPERRLPGRRGWMDGWNDGWSTVDLLHGVSFRCTAEWVSYTYPYIHSFFF